MRRGYAIARDVPFAEDGVTFAIDGWDPVARVGFEFLSRAEGDHDDLTADERERLIARIEAGALYLLILDEDHVDDADDLRFAADHFLDEVERRRGAAPLRRSADGRQKEAQPASQAAAASTSTGTGGEPR